MTALLGVAGAASAQTSDELSSQPFLEDGYNVVLSDRPIQAAESQEFCVTVMSGFPDDGHLARYQFFRLTEEMATDASPEFVSAMNHYADGDIADDMPIMDVIEDIANPVLRQAAPELAIASMAHLIDFAQRCESYVSGQVSSLNSFDASLRESDVVIQEDALYLRQVLSDSLFRLEADTDAVQRDNIEFASYNSEIDELEALYMVDLDGRLKRSNDLINSEMNRETLGDAVTLSDDLNQAENHKRKQTALLTLFRILNGF